MALNTSKLEAHNTGSAYLITTHFFLFVTPISWCACTGQVCLSNAVTGVCTACALHFLPPFSPQHSLAHFLLDPAQQSISKMALDSHTHSSSVHIHPVFVYANVGPGGDQEQCLNGSRKGNSKGEEVSTRFSQT